LEQSAGIEFDFKVERLGSLALFHTSSAVGIVAVALDVHDAVEVGVHNIDKSLDSVSQTIDNDVWSREVCGWWYWLWYRYASSLRISSESFDTLAVANVVERSSESIGATRVANARICTSQVTELAVFGGVAVRIFFALGNFFANSLLVESVSVWANTSSRYDIKDESACAIAHASALGVDNEPKVAWTGHTITLLIKGISWRTYTFLILIQDESTAWRTGFDWSTFNGGVAFVSFDTDTSHGPYRQCIQYSTNGIQSARFSQSARIDTLSGNARSL